MDQKTLEFYLGIGQEIQSIVGALGLQSKILPLEDTKNLLTIVMGSYENFKGEEWTLSCNVILNEQSGLDLYTQLYLTISDPIPQEKIEQVEAFIKNTNAHFLLGNLLLFENRLCLKHASVWDPSEAIPAGTFQHTVLLFFQHGNFCASELDKILKN